MQEFNIEVGDRVTLKYRNENRIYKWLMTCKSDAETALQDDKEIKKIERIGSNGWYTVYEKEEKKELLTEEERELLKVMIKYIYTDIKNIKKLNGKILLIESDGEKIAQIIIKDTILDFNNLEEDEEYFVSELRLYEGE